MKNRASCNNAKCTTITGHPNTYEITMTILGDKLLHIAL